MSLLDDLGKGGTTALTSAEFKELAKELRDEGFESGDARFLVLSDLLSQVDQWLASHERGIPVERATQINGMLAEQLPDVVAATSPKTGTALAVALARDIGALLGGAGTW